METRNFLKEQYESDYKSPLYKTRAQLIMDCLKDIPDDKPFWVHLEIGDLISQCWKSNLFDRAFEKMPWWFYCAWMGLKKDEDNVWHPVFTRIHQAAWNAAQSEYLKDKGEWCAKHGCD